MSSKIPGQNMPTGQSSSTTPSAAAESSFQPSCQEFSVRVPKLGNKPHSVMRFNAALNVDFAKWSHVKMCREENAKNHAKMQQLKEELAAEEALPKFGAGSEFGREAREEARRKKYGGMRKASATTDQPWVIKTTVADITKRFRGLREGGVSANARYYIFTQAPDGQFEVFPVDQWYNFTTVQTYKSLSAEEAEEEFGRRNKVMNLFSVMVRKRMKPEGDGEGDDGPREPGQRKNNKKKSGDFKVSEMDDWENESDGDSGGEGEDGEDGAKKKKAKPGSKKKKKKDSDDDMGEDSDDGDEEGRELDYISDTSGSESDSDKEKSELVGVEQEQGLMELFKSDSEEDSDEEKKGEEEGNEEDEETKNGKKDSRKDKKKSKKRSRLSDSDSEKEEKDVVDSKPKFPELATNSPQEDNVKEVAVKKEVAEEQIKKEVASSSSSSAGAGIKRKLSEVTSHQPSKKPKPEVSSALMQAAAAEGITEEAVRRYLLRKPMTVTELLHKFKSKKTKIQSQDMVNIIASILKTINPTKRMQNQKMYLFLKN